MNLSWLACGTELEAPGIGKQTIYDNFRITLPPGVEVAPTADHGLDHVGSATMNLLYSLWEEVPQFVESVSTGFKAVPAATACAYESQRLVGGPTPGEIVACYFGVNCVGNMYAWASLDAETGRYTLTLGTVHGFGAYFIPGITHIDMQMCAFFTTPGSSRCADAGDWIQKNGDASMLGCPGDLGEYTVFGTRRDGVVTPATNACVEWSATSASGFGT